MAKGTPHNEFSWIEHFRPKEGVGRSSRSGGISTSKAISGSQGDFQEADSRSLLVKNPGLSAQTSTKVPHFEGSFITVAESANKLGKSTMTITRWCESGKIPAIPKSYGTRKTYLISPAVIELMATKAISAKSVKQQKERQKVQRSHPEYILSWVRAMTQGTFKGKAFSSQTIEAYEFYAKEFFKRHKLLSAKTLELELLKIPAQHFGKREKVFKSLLCLGKWLIMQEALDVSFLQDIKRLTPKRHLPAKRHIGLKILL